MEKTSIQRQIEKAVTSGRGYDRRNTARIPFNLEDSEIGVQTALANMDVCDWKMDMHETIEFGSRLNALLGKFKRAAIPLEVITDANGFRVAMMSVHNYEEEFNPVITQDKLPPEYIIRDYSLRGSSLRNTPTYQIQDILQFQVL